jgi:soluble lytic murein transglycosylase-like protein
LLQIAAKTPYTFYGLIAERQLGLEPAISGGGFDLGDTLPSTEPSGPTAASAASGLAKLVKTDKRAHRAAAFAQIGLRYEAGQELRTALLNAGSAQNRKQWMALGLALNAPLTSSADLTHSGKSRFDLAQFPTPDLQPVGGFTIDRALVYAIVRQESGFRADAASNANAYGLMQLAPATAARVVGDDKLTKDPTPLRDPAFNLRVGQDYMTTLLGLVQGDVLRAVASYNAGPGTIMKTAKRMEPEADSLLVFESMPGGQTREFVQRVVSNYWIYRDLFGQDSPSLAALASGARTVSVDP